MSEQTNIRNNFYESDVYLILIGITALLAWFFKVPSIAMVLFAVVVLIISFTQDSLIGFLPILGVLNFIFPETSNIVNIYNAIAMVLLLGSVIFGSILLMRKRKLSVKFSPAIIGLVGLFIATFIGGITTTGHIGSTVWFMGIGTTGSMVILFFIASQTVRKYNPLYTAKICVIIALLMLAQVWISYLKTDNLVEVIMSKTLKLGWGENNHAAFLLLFTIPFVLYAMVKSDHFSFLYCGLFFLCALTMVSLLARASLLALAVCILPMTVYALRSSRHPILNLIFTLVFAVGIITIVFTLLGDYITTITNGFSALGVSDSGRYALWRSGWTIFSSSNPIWGSGYGYGSTLNLAVRYYFLWYHNDYLQVLSNMGILGLVMFLIHMVQRFYYATLKMTKFTVAVVWNLVLTSIYGFLDITYFGPYFLAPMLVIFLTSVLSTSTEVVTPEHELVN
ncbi:MAG: O-antigen ligase family protein [Christensenellaceae bacterium]|jgi:O-antigen ligase|nr:O-antigen ligase family protein [Christensenellaceae bacterium]